MNAYFRGFPYASFSTGVCILVIEGLDPVGHGLVPGPGHGEVVGGGGVPRRDVPPAGQAPDPAHTS